MPRVPAPLKRPVTLYREPRDRRSRTLTDPEAQPRDRGSDEDIGDDRADSDDNDEYRPAHAGTLPARRHITPRSTRNSNPDYTIDTHYRVDVVIDDVMHKTYSINVDRSMSDVPVPRTFDEAMKSKLRLRWIAAMEEELKSLINHETWELVSIDDVPKNRKIVKSRFVYTVKYNRDGTIERFKSRFVACGYSQVKGFDYYETFSATLRSTSFRLLVSIAAGRKLNVEHYDVKNAFTQSDIDAEIYVEAPPGNFTPKDMNGRPKVLKLKKALYGTKQASKLWQSTLVKHLTERMGFTRLNYDPCLFVKHDKGSHVMIVGVYVDDVVVAHNSPDLLSWFTREFTGPKGFNAKHLGKLSWFLGMAVDQHKDHSITIHQGLYIDKLLDKFVPSHSTSTRAHTMPCDPDSFQRLTGSRSPEEAERVSQLPYLELVGSLLYLSTMTRPDIAYHMSILCSHMHDPSLACYAAALNLLLYVGHTRHYHLRYSGAMTAPDGLRHADEIQKNSGFVAYSDSSWHKSDELGYDMFGYVVFLFGGPVAFAAKRLKVVALSSAEAEYAASSYACKEVAFVRNVCSELGQLLLLHGPVCFAVDNTAAIKIAENRGVTGRTKHFSDAIHYIRHMVDHLMVRLRHVSTFHQLADGFTKPLDKPSFRRWCSRLMSGVGEEHS